MIQGRLLRASDDSLLLPTVYRTSNAIERMRGLLGRDPLAADEGFLIDRCAAVHTLGMGYALDLVYLGSDWRVRKTVAALPPLRLSACPGAAMTLELAAHSINRLGIRTGEDLRWDSPQAA